MGVLGVQIGGLSKCFILVYRSECNNLEQLFQKVPTCLKAS
jgi:hypothetical protein